MSQLLKDVSYAARGLLRDRSFTLTTVATLTVALTLVTVVFAVFNAYVLRPYAVHDPYSLYEIRWSARQGSGGTSGRTFRWSDYLDVRARDDLFDDVLAERNRTVSSDGRTLLAAFVSGNYFEMLGARAHTGRVLAGFDARTPGSEPVAVVSYNAWTRLYDSDPGLVGRTIRLNDQVLTVVGIMREEFGGLNDTPPDVWLPATMHGPVMKVDLFGAAQPRELALIGRVRRGLSAQQVADGLSPLMARLVDRPGVVRAFIEPQATPAPLTLELLAVLSPVFAAFALVLVAACANVSNVMLARATARHREIGIRLSLGASRWRVIRQLLTEGLMIAALAGVASLALASAALRAGLTIFFMTIPATFAAIARVVPLEVDHRVFVFTLIVAGLTTVMFALLPALQTTKLTLTSALRGELASGVRGSRLRNGLVIGQVAVSLVLIVVAATLVRNASRLTNIDTGFDTHSLVSIKPQGRLLARTYDALSASSHVASVAVTSHNPLVNELPMSPVRNAQTNRIVPVSYMFVSPEYFPTVQLPITRGRGFTVDEARAEARVAIVSAAAAQTLWPGADPLGKTLRLLMLREEGPDVMTRDSLVSTRDMDALGQEAVVIGVANDIVNGLVYNGRMPHVYLPTAAGASHAKAVLARGRLLQDIRDDIVHGVLRTVDDNPLAFSILSLDEAMALQTYPLKVASWIGMLLSTIALALSVSGLYGVVAFSLSQRTKEIGIRMALGATSHRIVRMVMTQSGRLVAIGAGVGLLVSFSALGVLAAIVPLQNVSVLDGRAFAAAVTILAAAAALAAFFPSRRATRIDPSQALRADT